MLKEIFVHTDKQSLYSLIFDIRYQYTSHTTSFEELLVLKNHYFEKYEVVLKREGVVESYANEFCKLLNI
jgi:hypothetical protein